MSYEHDEHDQVHHAGRDSYGRPLVAGVSYLLSQPGKPSRTVTISEDTSTGDLAFSVGADQRMQRVEECAADCTFSKVIAEGQVDDVLLGQIHLILGEAAQARQQLDTIERRLSRMLGCEPGDASPAWDAISFSVRDGMGTPFDLAQLSQLQQA
jgi:hypothetical protein